MTSASTNLDLSPRLRDLIDAIAPKRFLADPFGLASGYRTYLLYTYLSARTDAELADLGISDRTFLPRIAMSAVMGTAR